MTPEERIAELERAVMAERNNLLKLWSVIEVACGVTAGYFPNGRAVIEHISKLRKVEPQRGQIMVQGWRPKNSSTTERHG
jgi:hypothetical protein